MCMIISDLFFTNRKSFEAHWLFLRANIYLPNLSKLLKTYKRVTNVCILWVTLILLPVSRYTFNSQNLTCLVILLSGCYHVLIRYLRELKGIIKITSSSWYICQFSSPQSARQCFDITRKSYMQITSESERLNFWS